MKATGRRRIFLMRHGHVDYFAPGISDPRSVPLTDLGREQARAAHDALSTTHFELICHSELPRTITTAEIVAGNRPEIPVIGEPNLEELKSGWLQVESREVLAARLAFSFDSAGEPGAQFLPDGETFEGAQARITAGLTNLIHRENWRTALVVAHEGVNRIILGWACGGGLATISAFEQDLACINVIDIDVTPAENTHEATSNEGGTALQIERAIIKAVNITPYDYVKHGLPRTSLEHLFDVDFGAARPTGSTPETAAS